MLDNNLPLKELIKRLDVICSVMDTALQPGGRATKFDLRIITAAAKRVVSQYEKEFGDVNATR